MARDFLTERARTAWKPNRGTIVYEAPPSLAGPDGARRAAGRHPAPRRPRRLARRHARAAPRRLDFQLVNEDGQWRIDNPVERPDGPVVVLRPQLRAVQPLLLRPDRSHAAAGPGLHPARRAVRDEPRPRPAGRAGIQPQRDQPVGPAPRHRPSTSRWWSPRAGSPRCRCRGRCCRCRAPSWVARVDQLAWTLRQVPGIERVRITVGGVAGPAAQRAHRRPGHQRDRVRRRAAPARRSCGACAAAASWTWLRPGSPITGPLGRPGYVDAQPRRERVAAPGRRGLGDGTHGVRGSRRRRRRHDQVTRAGRRRHRRAASPYDMFGDLWLVDRTTSGARVLVVRGPAGPHARRPRRHRRRRGGVRGRP